MRVRLSSSGSLPNRAIWYSTVGEVATGLPAKLETNGVAVDLTGATVDVKLVRASDLVVIRDWSSTPVDNAPLGYVRVAFLEAEIATAVDLLVTFRVNGGAIFPAGPQLTARFSLVPGGSSDNVNVPLLDYVTSACLCFSLRKRRSAYAGPCVRLRRASDNAEQDVGFTVAGLFDVAAAQTFAAGGNAFVTTWYDQTTFARHAVQATAIDQPQLVSAGVVAALPNGAPALQCVAGRVVTPTFTGLPQADTVIGGRYLAAATTYMCDGVTVTNRALHGATASLFRFGIDGSQWVNGPAVDTSPHVFVGRGDSVANDSLHVDGGAGVSGDGGAHTFTGLTIGSLRNGSFSNSLIADVFAGPRFALSEINEIGRQLALVTGSTWSNLP